MKTSKWLLGIVVAASLAMVTGIASAHYHGGHYHGGHFHGGGWGGGFGFYPSYYGYYPGYYYDDDYPYYRHCYWRHGYRICRGGYYGGYYGGRVGISVGF